MMWLVIGIALVWAACSWLVWLIYWPARYEWDIDFGVSAKWLAVLLGPLTLIAAVVLFVGEWLQESLR